MAVQHVYTAENSSPVAPSRLFKALVGDFATLIPKLLPQVVKSISVVEGDGGVGSTKLITFQEGVPSKNVKTRVDAIDAEKFTYKYTTLEGDILNEKIENISYEFAFTPGPNGGTIGTSKTTYTTKGDEPPTEEELEKVKKPALTMFKIVEGYLLQNPDVYV